MKKTVYLIALMFAFVTINKANYIFAQNERSSNSVEVSNESELVNAINEAKSNVETLITIKKDITLTNSVMINEAKKIMLQGINHNVTVYAWDNYDANKFDMFDLTGSSHILLRDIHINGNNAARLFYLIESSKITIERNAVLSNGFTTNANSGAGVYLKDESLLVMNGGVIEKNNSGKYGGGIATWDSRIEINGGIVRDNQGNYAGGIVSLGGSLALRGGHFENNIGNNNIHGGGIFVNHGSCTISGNVSFENNFLNNGLHGDIYLNTDQPLLMNDTYTGSSLFIKRVNGAKKKTKMIIGSDGHQITKDEAACFLSPFDNLMYLDETDNTIYETMPVIVSYQDHFNGNDNMIEKVKPFGFSCSLNEKLFSHEGYTLIGWNTNANGTGISYDQNDEILFENNLTLYAQWIQTPKLKETQIQMYGKTKLLTEYTDASFSNWQSSSKSIMIDNADNASASLVHQQATLSASMEYHGYQFPVSFSVESVPRKIIYAKKAKQSNQDLIHIIDGKLYSISDLLVFKYADDKNIEAILDDKDFTFTYSVDSENGGDSKLYTYHYLAQLAGDYMIDCTLKNPNYIVVSDNKLSNQITLQLKVVLPSLDRVFLDAIDVVDNTNFIYDGKGKQPFVGVLKTDPHKKGSIQSQDIDTFTLSIVGINETSYFTQIDMLANADIAAISTDKLPSEVGTYVAVIYGKGEQEYVYQAQVFTIYQKTDKNNGNGINTRDMHTTSVYKLLLLLSTLFIGMVGLRYNKER